MFLSAPRHHDGCGHSHGRSPLPSTQRATTVGGGRQCRAAVRGDSGDQCGGKGCGGFGAGKWAIDCGTALGQLFLGRGHASVTPRIMWYRNVMPNRGNQECPGAVATNWFRNEIGRKGSNFELPTTTTDLSSTPSTFLDPRISAVVAPQDNRIIPASRPRQCCIDTKTHPHRFLIEHLARLFSGADLRNRLRFCVGICLLGCPLRGPDTVVMTLGANGPPRIGEDWCCWCTGVAASAVFSASSKFCVASFGEFAQPLATQRSASTRNLSPFDRASLTPRRETPSSPFLWHAQPTSACAHRLVAVANL